MTHTHAYLLSYLTAWYLSLCQIKSGQVYRYFSKPMDPAEITSTIYAAREQMAPKSEEHKKYQKLLEANEKLQFMLRQKMIS